MTKTYRSEVMASRKLFERLFNQGNQNPQCFVEEADGERIFIYLTATHWDEHAYDNEECLMLIGTTVIGDGVHKWATKVTKGGWKAARTQGHKVFIQEDVEGDPLTLEFYEMTPYKLK